MPDATEQTIEGAREALTRSWSAFVERVDSVPAARREEPGVCGDWSLRQIVGHVAFWDGFEATRIRARQVVEEVDWQALNDRGSAEMATRSYGDLRAELDSHHERLLEAVAATPAIDPAWLVELTVDHYQEHLAEIDAWLARPPHGYGHPTPVAELLPRLDAAWNEWLAMLEDVPVAARVAPGVVGQWSVKDLLGHVALWDRQVVDDIDEYLAERPPLRLDWDGLNLADAERNAALSYDALLEAMLDAHTRLRTRLADVCAIDAEIVAVDTWDHYAEHTAHIRQWLAQPAGR